MAGGMSGPLGARGRRMPVAMAPITTTSPIPAATPSRMALPVERAASRVTVTGASSSGPSPVRSHAEGTFRGLMDGVRPPGWAEDHGRGVDRDRRPADLHGEPVHALRSRPQLVLPGAVVLGTMARALEPLALLAERHPAPEMCAFLVQGHEALLDQPRVERVLSRSSESFVVDDVEAPGPVVVGLPARGDLTLDHIDGIRKLDHRAEPSRQAWPQHGQRGPPELGGE